MATIKAVVRKARTDGFFPVYIRIVHRSRMGYIKTDKIVSPKGIAKSGDIIDQVVNEYCAKAILRYSDMCFWGALWLKIYKHNILCVRDYSYF